MRWSDADILFRPEDHPDTELSDRNLPFIMKTPIGCHKVVKTLIDSGASLNLMMRKTFMEMGLNLAELTPMHDTFHGIIPGQSSTPIGRIDLEVSCGTGENKHRVMLTFEVASFDIRYNCILGRYFLLKFMAIIHTAYATIKMPGPKCIIVLKSDQPDALACENTTLTHEGSTPIRTMEEALRSRLTETQELAVKVVKAHEGSTPIKTTEVTTDRTTQFPGAVVTVGRRGPGGGDGREDDAFPKHGGDGQATWTRWRWWCRGSRRR
jgi:hypothetical protein